MVVVTKHGFAHVVHMIVTDGLTDGLLCHNDRQDTLLYAVGEEVSDFSGRHEYLSFVIRYFAHVWFQRIQTQINI
jgi:hypothetical protein